MPVNLTDNVLAENYQYIFRLFFFFLTVKRAVGFHTKRSEMTCIILCIS